MRRCRTLARARGSMRRLRAGSSRGPRGPGPEASGNLQTPGASRCYFRRADQAAGDDLHAHEIALVIRVDPILDEEVLTRLAVRRQEPVHRIDEVQLRRSTRTVDQAVRFQPHVLLRPSSRAGRDAGEGDGDVRQRGADRATSVLKSARTCSRAAVVHVVAAHVQHDQARLVGQDQAIEVASRSGDWNESMPRLTIV